MCGKFDCSFCYLLEENCALFQLFEKNELNPMKLFSISFPLLFKHQFIYLHTFITKLIFNINSPLIVQQVYIFFDGPFVHFEVLYVQLATPTPTDLVQLMQVLNYHVQNMENKSWLVYYSRSDSLPVGI